MNHAIIILLCSAVPIGCIHTLTGPDHYLPFIALSKARKWSLLKTVMVTLFCGIGHVLSALVLGLLGVALGYTLTKISLIADFRNNVAAWMLIGFGFAYFLWGLRTIFKHERHKHTHLIGHAHSHKKSWKELTPWILFIVFVLGPCEQLIPLIMYPAIKGLMLDVFIISLLYGVATILTMEGVVIASVFGTKLVRLRFLEKYGNATAGAIICCTGIVIKVFGL
jgi:nickel/cobalt transporter (NicO) family protein